MNKFIGHLKTVCKHKHYVFLNCVHCGIPLRGLLHDLSKFSPTEFWESVKYYQGNRSPIDACKEDKGISMAWLHHKGRNKHHYEYWAEANGKVYKMPFKYCLEMFCDYMGAGRAYMGKKFNYSKQYEWWLTARQARPIHTDNKHFLDDMFEYAKNYNCLPSMKIIKHFKRCYWN